MISQHEVFIGFGGNLGDRCSFINQALRKLTKLPTTSLEKLSSLYETAPVGYLEQGAFLNGVALIKSSLGAFDLLERLLEIESLLGRVRKQRWGPRTVDLDIILYGNHVIDAPNLLVPHPELTNRIFVLEPLSEIVPDRLHPQLGGSISEFLRKYQSNNPQETPCRIMAGPPEIALTEVKDGIFYRYS